MFSYSGIKQYHQQLINRETDCFQAVSHYLNRIDQNSYLNAFVEVYAQEALDKARRLDEERLSGKPMKRLHGVVVALKDVICYQGHKVTAASNILHGFESTFSASALQYLLDEDAIIIGNCNCDEFAMGSTNENSFYGPVRNALDHERVPGGSSGGSAVAVQADMCMLSLGSDTGGSVRQPADFCGIIGLKPSYGRISRYGLIAYASSFDQIGIFGKYIDDIALALEIMGKPDEYDSTMITQAPATAYSRFRDTTEKPYRIAYFRQVMEHPSLDPEMSQAINQTLLELTQQGHSVEAVEFDLIDYIVPTYYVLTTAEASSNLARFDGVRYGHRTSEAVKDLTDFYCRNRSEGFGREVKRRIMLGSFVLSAGFYDAYFQKAQQVRRRLYEQINMIFNDFDVLLMPTSPSTAFKMGENPNDPVAMYLADIFTVLANLVGIPGISIPLYQHSNGMPFGLQAMTQTGDELTLLQFSARLMQPRQP
ncbi:MAG: Asp-tRNA(Asn)/Glu-tRNA(Gln) amidotransferase subunit GatA [Ferruginibacter sp.]